MGILYFQTISLQMVALVWEVTNIHPIIQELLVSICMLDCVNKHRNAEASKYVFHANLEFEDFVCKEGSDKNQ